MFFKCLLELICNLATPWGIKSLTSINKQYSRFVVAPEPDVQGCADLAYQYCCDQ